MGATEIRWVHIAKRHTALLVRESTSSTEYYRGRTSKQCRERWNNHLRPNLRKCSWSEEEDLKLIDLYEKHGNKFTIIGIALNRADIHVAIVSTPPSEWP